MIIHKTYNITFVNNKINSKSYLLNIDEQFIYQNASRYPNNSTWESIATYLNYKHRLKENIIFQSGIRYSHILINADLSKNNQFWRVIRLYAMYDLITQLF